MRILMLLSIVCLCNGQTNAQTYKLSGCGLMRAGTFKYLEAEDPTAYFVITDTSHTEYYRNGKYHIKSRMKWVSDCKYSLIMFENTVPDFPFNIGDKLLVTINKVENDIIYYTSEIKGSKWETSVRKIITTEKATLLSYLEK